MDTTASGVSCYYLGISSIGSFLRDIGQVIGTAVTMAMFSAQFLPNVRTTAAMAAYPQFKSTGSSN